MTEVRDANLRKFVLEEVLDQIDEMLSKEGNVQRASAFYQAARLIESMIYE